MAQDDFARRLLITMRELARDVGHPSAYPPTREGQLEALRQRLRMMEQAHAFSDFQRGLVREELRRARADEP
jgi:hypothetical protein